MSIRKKIVITGLVMLILLPAVSINANNANYRIFITDIQRNVTENFLRVPHSVDYTVYWDFYEEGNTSKRQLDISSITHFRALCIEEGKELDAVNSGDVKGNFYTFDDLKVGKKYGIFIEGYRQDKWITVSDTAWVVSGRQLQAAGSSDESKWHHFIPFNGRIPMSIIGRANVFDTATKAGKMAFHMIWNALIAGVFIWLFFCVRHLSLRRIFPMGGNPIQIQRNFNDAYQGGISGEFKDIIREWRGLVERANDHMRTEIGKNREIQSCDIEAANINFWQGEGTKLVRNLLNRTTNPKMNQYPSVRIIQAGLENHELGGFRWLEASKEVDRAIENRAASELETLRRKSLLDWLWNLGTLSPLIGLFGTATGISHAFAMLTMLHTDMTQTALVVKLAGGIFEALWTTIEGLFVGILMMLLYYYYQNKLNWIYSKWEEIYVYVTEKL